MGLFKRSKQNKRSQKANTNHNAPYMLEMLEPRLLLSAEMDVAAGELSSAIGQFSTEFESFYEAEKISGNLNTPLPLINQVIGIYQEDLDDVFNDAQKVAPSIDSLLAIDIDLNADFVLAGDDATLNGWDTNADDKVDFIEFVQGHFVSQIQTWLSGPTSSDPADFYTFLNGLDRDFHSTISGMDYIGDINFDVNVVSNDSNANQVAFDIQFRFETTKELPLDLGRGADELGLGFPNALTVTTNFDFDMEFGVLTSGETPTSDDAFLAITNIVAGVDASIDPFIASFDLGFLGLETWTNGGDTSSITLDAELTADFVDPTSPTSLGFTEGQFGTTAGTGVITATNAPASLTLADDAEFLLRIGNADTTTITVDSGTYGSFALLVAEVQTGLNAAGLTGIVTASDSGGKIQLTVVTQNFDDVGFSSGELTLDGVAQTADVAPTLSMPISFLLAVDHGAPEIISVAGSAVYATLVSQLNTALSGKGISVTDDSGKINFNPNPGSHHIQISNDLTLDSKTSLTDLDLTALSFAVDHANADIDFNVRIATGINGLSQSDLEITFTGDAFGQSLDTLAPDVKDQLRIFLDANNETPLDLTDDITFTNFGDLLNFNEITPTSFLAQIRQLGTWLDNARQSDVFSSIELPFANGDLGDVLDFADLIDDALLFDDGDDGIGGSADTEKLMEVVGGALLPRFTNAQGLASMLDATLGVLVGGAAGANYNSGTSILTYDINISHDLIDIDLPIDFNLDLSPLLDISSNSTVVLDATAGLQITLGIDLSPATGGLTPATTLDSIDPNLVGEIEDGPALTATNAPNTIYGRLNSDAVFNVIVGPTYYVIVVDGDTIKLAETVNDANSAIAINLTADGTGASHRLTEIPGMTYAEFDGASDVNPGADQITLTSHGLTTGDAVVYTDGGGTGIVGLTGSTIYEVTVYAVDPDDVGVLDGTDENTTVAHLVADINNALANAEEIGPNSGTGRNVTSLEGISASLDATGKRIKLSSSADFQVTAASGNPAVTELGFLTVHEAEGSGTYALTTNKDAPRLVGRLTADAQYTITIGGTAYTVTVEAGETDANRTIIDLINDLNNAVETPSLISGDVGVLTALTADASFSVAVNGGSPVVVTIPFTSTNGSDSVLFDGSSGSIVDVTDNEITLTGHTLLTGDEVVYSNGVATDIGGLTNTTTYYVIAVDSNTVKLAASLDDANSNAEIDLTALGTGTSHTLTDIANTSFEQLVDDINRAIGATALAGLIVAERYERDSTNRIRLTADDDSVVEFDLAVTAFTPAEDDLKLPVGTTTTANLNNLVEVLSQGDNVVLKAYSSELTFDGATDVNTTDDTITITSHGLVTGTALVYSNGTGTDIAPLADTATYYAIVVDADTIKLALSPPFAFAGTAIVITAAGTGADQTLTVNPAATFTVNGTGTGFDDLGFIDGQASNSNDFIIRVTSPAGAPNPHPYVIDLDTATDISDVITMIGTQTNGDVTVTISDDGSGLVLEDTTWTGADSSPVFYIQPTNASPVAIRLGILKGDPNGDFDGDGDIDGKDGDGVIEGGALAGTSLADRFFIENATVSADFDLSTPAIPYTTLTIDGSDDTIVTADTAFDLDNIGQYLDITAGAGFSTGRYRIINVDPISGSATLDSSPGATSTAGGTAEIKGVQASASLGFVGVDLVGAGSLTGSISADLIEPVYVDGRILLSELFEDLGSLTDFIQQPTFNGSGSMTLDILLRPDISLITLGATPQIVLTVNSIGDPFTTIDFPSPLWVDANTFTLVDDKTSIFTTGNVIDIELELGSPSVPAEVLTSTYDAGLTTIDLVSNVLSGGSIHKVTAPTPPDIDVTFPNPLHVEELLNFEDISFDDILAALEAVVGFLADVEGLDFFDKEIPLINQSVNDLLSFADKLATALEEIQDDPAGTIQLVEAKLKNALGMPISSPDILSLDLINPEILRFDLDVAMTFSKSLGVEIPNFLDAGTAGIPGLSGLIDLSGSADLNASGSLTAELDFGVDLSLANLGDVYIYETTGVAAHIEASGSNLSFWAALGPFGLYIQSHPDFNSEVSISGDFDFDIKDDVFTDDRAAVTLVLSSLSNFETNISGSVDGTLPTFFPNESAYIGNITLTGDLANIDSFHFRTTATAAPADHIVLDVYDVIEGIKNFDFTNQFNLFDNILLAMDGIDYFLEGLQYLLDTDIFGNLSLPVIGNPFNEGASFIEDFRVDFVQPVRDLIEKAEDAGKDFADADKNLLSKYMYDILSSLNLLQSIDAGRATTLEGGSGFQGYWGNDANKEIALTTNFGDYLDDIGGVALADTFIQWDLAIGGVYSFGKDFDFDIGLPGLGMEADGDVEIKLAWDLDIGFGISYQDGFYFNIEDANELTAYLIVDLGDTQLTGKLGFLQLTAAVNEVDLGVAFEVDIVEKGAPELSDDAKKLKFTELGKVGIDFGIAAEAIIDLGLELQINSDLVGPSASSGFPSVSADFILDWGIGDLDFGDPEDSEFVSLGELGDNIKNGLRFVGFTDVTLDLGSFISDVLGPIVGTVQDVTGPIQPLVDFVTTPFPVISDFGLNITPLDLAAAYGQVDPGLIYAIADIITLVNSIPDPDEVGELKIPIGEFAIFDDGTSTYSLDPGNASFTGIDLWDGDIDLDAAFDQVKGYIGEIFGDNWFSDALSFVAGEAADIMGDLTGDSGAKVNPWSFPILEDPMQVFGLFMGRPAVLVTYDMAPLEFEFEYSQFFPIYGPLGVSINVELGAVIDFAFGYDTLGIQEFVESDFRNPALLIDGFYVSDTDLPTGDFGTDVPELVLTGGLWAAAEINLVMARAGVGGGVFIEVDFDLFDPDRDGRVRIKEIFGNIYNEFVYGEPALAPLAIFDVHGEITAKLFAFLKVDLFLFEIDKRWDLTPEITIVEFDIPFTRPPILATELEGGNLQLNAGQFADQRLNGNIDDISENFEIKEVSSGVVAVRAPGLWGHWQEYDISGSDATIIFKSGEGDDTLTVVGAMAATTKFEIDAGVGNDTIRLSSSPGAAGASVITGSTGDDVLVGGSGNDIIYGLEGNDTISGGGGDDIIFGDNGRIASESITGFFDPTADGNDIISGGVGSDIIFGSGGVDTIYGDDETTLSGADDNDIIIGEGGKVTFKTFNGISAVSISADTLTMTAHGLSKGQIVIYTAGGSAIGGLTDGNAYFVILVDSNTIQLAATPQDVIDDNPINLTSIGANADYTLTTITGTQRDSFNPKGGADILIGSNGMDVIFGGTGSDLIDGGAGDDYLYGEEGNDTIYGGSGADTIDGGEGGDTIYGERDTGATTKDTTDGSPADANDLIYGQAGRDTIFGDSDDDTAGIATGEDIIYGGSGADTIDGDGGADQIFGGGDPDWIEGGTGGDVIDGQAGNDIIFGDRGFEDIAGLSQTFDAAAQVNPPDGEIFLTAHGFLPGQTVKYSAGGGTPITGLSETATYYVIVDSENVIRLASSLTDAWAGIAVDITGLGAGTDHVLIPVWNPTVYGVNTLSNYYYLFGATYSVLPVGLADNNDTSSIYTADEIRSGSGSDFLDGQWGNDRYLLRLLGTDNDGIISVHDSGNSSTQSDFMHVKGTMYDDNFLLRKSSSSTGLSFVALLNQEPYTERINYWTVDGGLGLERMLISGLFGDDHFASDDVGTDTTIEGNEGEDTFQVGQLYNSPRDLCAYDYNHVETEDVFATIETTVGWLSDGINRPMTIYGGVGNDYFTVFHNKAVLSLFGEDGDDTFLIKAFAMAGSQEPFRDRTDVSGGAGVDLVQYAMNAPVNIDGGDGFDRVIIIGTEFGDDFVVTRDGVYGAGLNVNFVNVESLSVDGAEGDDRFYVLSTGEDLITELFGGLGSDTFNMSGPTPPIISNDLRGHNGVITHEIEKTGTSDEYDDTIIAGISANITDDDTHDPVIVISEPDGSTEITEGAAGYDSYYIVLPQAPMGPVTVQVNAPVQTLDQQERKSKLFKVSSPTGIDPAADGSSLSLVFTAADWYIPQEVRVSAPDDGNTADDNDINNPVDIDDFDDLAIEGDKTGFINHVVTTSIGISGMADTVLAVVDENDSTLYTTEFTDNGMVFPDLIGYVLQITDGPGAGQSLFIKGVKEGFPDTLILQGRFRTCEGSAVGPASKYKITRNIEANRAITVLVHDNELADVTVTPSDNSTELFEAGDTDTIDIVLTRQPEDSDVTVTLASNDTQLTFSDNTLVFDKDDGDPDDWNDVRTVTVTAFDDDIREGFHHGLITFTSSGGDNDVLSDTPYTETIIVGATDGQSAAYVGLLNRPASDGGGGYLVTSVTFDDGPALAADRFEVISNKIVFLDANGDYEEIAAGTKVDVTYRYNEVGYDGRFVKPHLTNIADNDVPQVKITETGDGTDVIEIGGEVTSPAAVGTSTLTDSSAHWGVWNMTGYMVIITEGAGAGQIAEIASNTSNKITIPGTWSEALDDTSRYEIMVVDPAPYLATSTGTVTAGFLNALFDATASWGSLDLTQDYIVRITKGTGKGQIRLITSQLATILAVADAWTIIPDATSEYEIVPLANPWFDTYDVVLTKAPEGGEVRILVDPQITKTSSGRAIFWGEQVRVTTDAPGATHNTDGTITLVFTDTKWNTPQTIKVTALNDENIDGDDTQVFAPEPHTVSEIQGPLYLYGQGGNGSIVDFEPLMLDYETNFMPETDTFAQPDEGIEPDGLTMIVGAELLFYGAQKLNDEVNDLIVDDAPGQEIADMIVDEMMTITLADGIIKTIGTEDIFIKEIGQFRLIIDAVFEDLGTPNDPGEFDDDDLVTLTFNEAWDLSESWAEFGDDTDSYDIVTEYAVTEMSPNFFAIEAEKIDYLFVYNEDSPADNVNEFRAGLLTDSTTIGYEGNVIVESFVTTQDGKWLSGLGMASEDLFLGGVLHPRGITYGDMEVVEINLGDGIDDFTVEDTHTRSDGYQTWTIINTGDEPEIDYDGDGYDDGDVVDINLTGQLGVLYEGAVASAGTNTLAVASPTFPVATFNDNDLVGFLVEITGGTGLGQQRVIVSNTTTELTFEKDWNVALDTTSQYRVLGSQTHAGRISSDDLAAMEALFSGDIDEIGELAVLKGNFSGFAVNELQGLVIEIIDGEGGLGVGTKREIISNTATEVVVSSTWNTNLDTTNSYRIHADWDGPIAVNGQGGRDIINGEDSNVPLIIFGGDGEDFLTGGSADDIIFGDQGRVEYVNEEGKIVTLLGFARELLDPQYLDAYTINTLTDNDGNFPVWSIDMQGLEGFMISTPDGRGFGQRVRITDNTTDLITVTPDWDLEDENHYIVVDGAAAPDIENNIITVGVHDLVDGQRIIYTNGGGTSIGGLTDGQTYFVIFDSSTTIQLAAEQGGAAIDLTELGSGDDHHLTTPLKVVPSGYDPITDFDPLDPQGNPTKYRVSLIPEDQTDGVKRDPVLIIATDPTIGGNDTIIGNAGDDRIFGGAADDTINGNDGDDTIFGDHGRLDYTPAVVGGVDGPERGDFVPASLNRIRTTYDNIGGSDTITGDAGNDIILGGYDKPGTDILDGNTGDDILIGDNGVMTFVPNTVTPGDPRDVWLDEVKTLSHGIGGTDIISGNEGDDIAIGGTDADTIYGDDALATAGELDGEDILIGDNGRIDFTPGETARLNAFGSGVNLIETTDVLNTTGGGDTISGNAQADVILGGVNNGETDTIYGDAATPGVNDDDDVILGDNGQLDFAYGGDSDLTTLDLIRSLPYDDAVAKNIILGGVDSISGDAGNDTVIGGVDGDTIHGDDVDANNGAEDGKDILIGDNGEIFLSGHVPARLRALGSGIKLIQTTDDEEATGGADLIEGNADDDVVIGGVNNGGIDVLHGDATIPGGYDAEDILLGDNGRLDYNTGDDDLTTLDLIQTFDTGLLGGRDIILGNDDDDIAMGGTGDDDMYGDFYAEIDHNGNTVIGPITSPAPGEDILIGDGGEITLASGVITVIRTIEPDQGGSDHIEGNDLIDKILGGFDDDELYGEAPAADLDVINAGLAGDDWMLGDNGRFDYILASDTIEDRHDVAIHLGGTEVGLDEDSSNLDRVMTTDVVLGGNDVMYGNGGNDIMFGGTATDTMRGDTDDIAAGPDGADGIDLMFGDHAKIFPTLPTVDNFFFNNNFFSINTQFEDDGFDDIMFGNGDDDIMIGGQGDDIMFGGNGDDDMIGGFNVANGDDELDDMPGVDQLAISPIDLADLNAADFNEINDIMDGGADDDVMTGDNAYIIRQPGGNQHDPLLSPRFRILGESGLLYIIDSNNLEGLADVDVGFHANVTADHQPHQDMTLVRTVYLYNHDEATEDAAVANPNDPRPFGNDVIAGGTQDDEIWGQLGDDIIQGDGEIEMLVKPAEFKEFNPAQDAIPDFDIRESEVLDTLASGVDTTFRFSAFEDEGDGDDYIEGNGGNDRIYGGLGQDDLIGGSSILFGLDGDYTMRPDGADLIYGGAGNPVQLSRNASFTGPDNDISNDDSVEVPTDERHARDADVILGDNGEIYRIVTAEESYESFNYDYNATTANGFEDNGFDGDALMIIPRAVDLNDYGYSYENTDADSSTREVLTFTDDVRGEGDLIYGESGDDVIHGMTGNDTIFGNSEHDDIYGEIGTDFLLGGTGIDGILGDDGLILTRRNDLIGEPLYGIEPRNEDQGTLKNNEEVDTNALNAEIATPGNIQRAIINIEGELVKVIETFTFRTDDLDGQIVGEFDDSMRFNDIVFGGLDNDFIHGIDGDDAISGAEALPVYYSGDTYGFEAVNTFLQNMQSAPPNGIPDLADNPFWFGFSPYNPGEILRYEGKTIVDGNGQNPKTRDEFAWYDEFNPRRKIMFDFDTLPGEDFAPLATETGAVNTIDFLLNFNEDEGPLGYHYLGDENAMETDGDDRIFGDVGHDWIVGGTGRDNMYGGRGNDLINMDDNHDSEPGGRVGPHDPEPDPLDNTQSDEYQAYADIVYAGAGRDIMILNTGADRSLDWVGEFNSYIVPFSPFGAFHISRNLSPHVPEYLQDLSESDGADVRVDPGKLNNVPDAQLYVDQKNIDVRIDEPDPLRNYEPYGELGMVRQQDLDWGEQTGAPNDPQPGNLQGKRDIMRRELFQDTVAPKGAFAETEGIWTANDGKLEAAPVILGEDAVSIYHLDKIQPSYMEILVTINAEKDKAGFKSNAYIIFDYKSSTDFKFAGVDVGIDKIQIGHYTVDGWIINSQIPMQLKADIDYDLTLVLYGTVATIWVDENTSLSFDFNDVLNDDGLIGLATNNAVSRFDDWQVQKLPPTLTFQFTEDFAGTSSNPFKEQIGNWMIADGHYSGSIIDGDRAITTWSLEVATWSLLELEALINTESESTGGLIFDYYDADNFKFAAIDALNDQVVIGYYTSKGWFIEASVERVIEPGTSYTLGISMLGTSVSVTLDGEAVVGHVFNSLLNDGDLGLLSKDGVSSFDDVVAQGDDPAYAEESGDVLMAASLGDATDITDLNHTELAPIIDAAIDYWVDIAGVDASLLADVSFLITDLSDMFLAVTVGNTILIDIDAAGYGWFVDETPYDNIEFDDDGGNGELTATLSSEAEDLMDLLTVVTHELGHVLGLEDVDAEEQDLMSDTLATGVRRVYTESAITSLPLYDWMLDSMLLLAQ